MSALVPWLLAVALAWPAPAFHVESTGARRDRLEVASSAVAWAIDRAVMTGALPGRERRLWAALAMATVERESGRLDLAVHDGSRLGDSGRSICFGQINRGNPGAFPAGGWRSLAGTDLDASKRCAWAMVRTLAAARRRCLGKAAPGALLDATVSVYVRGHGCRVGPESKARVERAWAALAVRPLPD